jgi:hypothetical protein
MGLEVKGMKNRFYNGDSENINPFVLINQNIINGKAFFDYIETYVEIYKQLFLDSDEKTYLDNLDLKIHLVEFKAFYKKHCCEYGGANRSGDTYLRELYKSLIFLMFDKYWEEGVNKFYETLYALIYRMRLEKLQVKYAAVAAYPIEYFSIIEQSNTYIDLHKLVRLAHEEIVCRKEVTEIIQFFINFGVTLTTKDTEIELNKYKKTSENGNNKPK